MSSRSLIKRVAPFFAARIRENYRVLSSSSSSSSALREASVPFPSPDAVHMTENCIQVLSSSYIPVDERPMSSLAFVLLANLLVFFFQLLFAGDASN